MTYLDDEVIELSSGDEDKETIESESDTEEDLNLGGMHTNDQTNQPDEDGKVQINMGHPPEDPDIYLASQISKAIKPHQVNRIFFAVSWYRRLIALCKKGYDFNPFT